MLCTLLGKMPSQKNSRIFFGWWIVAAAFIIACYVGGVVLYGFTAVFEPIAHEMGWSYAQISFASSLRGLENGLVAPLIGIFVGRYGPRRLVLVSAFFTAGGLIILSNTHSLLTFYTAFLLIAVGVSANGMAILMASLVNWFNTRLGLVSGIVASGFAFGGLLVPVIVKLINIYGWRKTDFLLAIGVLGIVLPLGILFRHKPEQYGYYPDGQMDVVKMAGPLPVEKGAGVVEILKNGTFWRIALPFTCHAMLVPTVLTHIMPYLTSINVNRDMAGIITTGLPLASIIGRLGFGWISDRKDKRFSTVISFIMLGAGMLCLSYSGSLGMVLLVPFILLFGIGYGGTTTLRTSLARDYFGRAGFATAFGFIIGVNMIGNMVGPVLAGWVYDTWGSYRGIWLIFVLLPVIAILITLSLKPSDSVRKATAAASLPH